MTERHDLIECKKNLWHAIMGNPGHCTDSDADQLCSLEADPELTSYFLDAKRVADTLRVRRNGTKNDSKQAPE